MNFAIVALVLATILSLSSSLIWASARYRDKKEAQCGSVQLVTQPDGSKVWGQYCSMPR